VLLFTLGVSLLAGLLFGAIPVFKYAGARVAGALRQGGRTLSEGRERHRARSVLVVVQVALALVLLVSSGLMIRTLRALRNVQPGFTNPQNILSFHVAIPEAQVHDAEAVLQLEHGILSKIQAIPGVTSASIAGSATMEGMVGNDPVYAQDRTYADGQIPPVKRYKYIAPGEFHTMGNPLLAGRDLTWSDIYEKRPVVLMSETLAREYWGSPAAAIGKRVRENPKGVWREVIGVAGDEHDDGVNKPAPGIIYWPILVSQFWGDPVDVQRFPAFLIRSSRARSGAFVQEAERAVWALNPNLTVTRVSTVQEIYDKSLARTAFTLVMLTIAAGMALLLGLVGIYGVVSYSVSQRTREIGIRMALGAQQQSVRQMFVKHALRLTATGVACGLAAAFALTRLMSALLYGVSALDPLTYVAVSAVLALAALAASYLPARRATGIDPAIALRAE
jgi:predicted permease